MANLQNDIVIATVYEWLKNYIEFPHDFYEENKRIAVREGIRMLIDEGAFAGYSDIRKTLLTESGVLLPIKELKRLAVRE